MLETQNTVNDKGETVKVGEEKNSLQVPADKKVDVKDGKPIVEHVTRKGQEYQGSTAAGEYAASGEQDAFKSPSVTAKTGKAIKNFIDEHGGQGKVATTGAIAAAAIAAGLGGVALAKKLRKSKMVESKVKTKK
jgi:hypothetical protein